MSITTLGQMPYPVKPLLRSRLPDLWGVNIPSVSSWTGRNSEVRVRCGGSRGVPSSRQWSSHPLAGSGEGTLPVGAARWP